ncbi:MAG TPA: Rrf2 family transcriptional regulator [Actinospica sp.]|jgi:Rrf2 family protein|nr:Rrf2 family transcriptional regulator [Actinospica sp.]
MRISARTDYALRVLVSLADAASRPLTCEGIAEQQGIPYRFLKSVVRDLRLAGLVRSQRGCEGGYWIGREAATISVADVVAAVDGDLLTVNGEVPDPAGYPAPAARLETLWRGLHAHLAELFGGVSIADLAGAEPGERAAALFADALTETGA